MIVSNPEPVIDTHTIDIEEDVVTLDKEYQIYDMSMVASLINISGRQRMLSQRIAFLLCARLDARMTDLKKELEAAFDLFESSHQLLKSGNSDYPAPLEGTELFEYFHGDVNAHKRITHFLHFGRALHKGSQRNFNEFYRLSALEIVPLLNQGVKVYEGLASRISQRIAENMCQKNKNIRNTFQEVRDIHQMIKAVSINAAIASARAGDYGTEFNVIVNEIQLLAKQIEDLVENGLTALKEADQTEA